MVHSKFYSKLNFNKNFIFSRIAHY